MTTASAKQIFYDRVEWRNIDGKLHNDTGPARIYDTGTAEYRCHGKLHRLDGPAIVLPNGDNVWWINGRLIDNEIHQWAKEFNIDLNNLADEDKQMITLYWGDYGKHKA